MIGFNGKYLSAAAIGDMRITAMSQGDKWLLDNRWLMVATQAAILSAFGAEGAGVIQATNAYLNGLATTDREKAQALAGFINEDPMLVCSIVETSKTRWLVGDGKAYIDTGVKFDANDEVLLDFYSLSNSGNYAFFGAKNTEGAEISVFWNNTRLDIANPSSQSAFSWVNSASNIFYADKHYKLTYNKDACILLDVDSDTSTTSDISMYANFVGTQPVFLFAVNRPSIWHGWFKCAKFRIGNKAHLLPFIRNGECGMIDILTGTFYPNANTEGAFTIQLTDKQ